MDSKMIISAVVKCIYIVAVTLAAVAFQSTAILWWYLFALILGYEYTSKK